MPIQRNMNYSISYMLCKCISVTCLIMSYVINCLYSNQLNFLTNFSYFSIISTQISTTTFIMIAIPRCTILRIYIDGSHYNTCSKCDPCHWESVGPLLCYNVSTHLRTNIYSWLTENCHVFQL